MLAISIIQRNCDKFVDQLIGNGRYNSLLFIVEMYFVRFNFDMCSLCVVFFIVLFYLLRLFAK